MSNKQEDEAIDRIDYAKGLERSMEAGRERVKKLVAALTPKEREILATRFGVSVEELESGRVLSEKAPAKK